MENKVSQSKCELYLKREVNTHEIRDTYKPGDMNNEPGST